MITRRAFIKRMAAMAALAVAPMGSIEDNNWRKLQQPNIPIDDADNEMWSNAVSNPSPLTLDDIRKMKEQAKFGSEHLPDRVYITSQRQYEILKAAYGNMVVKA